MDQNEFKKEQEQGKVELVKPISSVVPTNFEKPQTLEDYIPFLEKLRTFDLSSVGSAKKGSSIAADVSIGLTDTDITNLSFVKYSGQTIIVLASGFIYDTGAAGWYNGAYLKLFLETNAIPTEIKIAEFSTNPQAATSDRKTLSMMAVLTDANCSVGNHTIYLKAAKGNASQTLAAKVGFTLAIF